MNENNWSNPCPKYDCRKAACECGLEYVNIPASLGDDSEGSNVAPKNGAYCNALVIYEANNHVYIYSKEGVPTLIDVDASDISTLEQEVRKAQKDVYELREDIDDFIYGYDTVASMKLASNLDNGDRVRTYGYYAKNDGGGAYYRVVNSVPSGPYETLGNMRYAELIIEDTMNVRQFGAKGDGTTDDTNSINKAIANSKRIIVNEGVYKISRFLPAENQEFIGVGNAKILTNGLAPQVVFNNYNTVTNIKFESASESLEWNRASIDHRNDVTLLNCSFVGFRHQSSAPNAWGIILGNAKRVYIRKCYFDNNTQSDIALVNGCEDIVIESCNGTNFHINVEPDGTQNKNRNITIENCAIHVLNLLENQLTGIASESVLVSNCTIDLLMYDGSTTTIVGSNIKDIIPQPSSVNAIGGGVLRFVNSGNFSKNLVEDPYLDTFEFSTSSTQPWYAAWSSISLGGGIDTVKDNDGIQTVINYKHYQGSITLRHQLIPVDDSKKYILRVNGKGDYPSDALWVSIVMGARWLDIDGNEIKTNRISLFKSKPGTMSPFSEQVAVLPPPEGAKSVELRIYNASQWNQVISATNAVYIRSVELFEFRGSVEPNTIEDLPIREHRTFENSVTPNASYTKYLAGDKLYFKNPTTYIGQIATTDGYGSAAGWTNFGALES